MRNLEKNNIATIALILHNTVFLALEPAYAYEAAKVLSAQTKCHPIPMWYFFKLKPSSTQMNSPHPISKQCLNSIVLVNNALTTTKNR